MPALRLALRDMRATSGGVRLLVTALIFAVAAIAAVASIADAMREGLQGHARESIGGDISLRLFHRAPSADERAVLGEFGRTSKVGEMRARVRPVQAGADKGAAAELKAVDDAYPLYGTVGLDPAMEVADAVGLRDGVHGAVADGSLMAALGAAPGDRLRLGAIEIELRARILDEPDRSLRAVSLGGRLIVHADALDASGLADPGAQIFRYVRIALPEGTDSRATVAEIGQRLPDAGWRIVDAADGVPGIERTIELARALLILVGLAVLLIAGVGVAGAVTAHLASRTGAIALLKSLGATRRTAAAVYLLQIGAAALVAVALGLAVGLAVHAAVLAALHELLPFPPGGIVQPAALVLAAAFGLLVAMLAALFPLDRAGATRPAALWRAPAEPAGRWRPRPATLVMAALVLAALLAILIAATGAMPAITLAAGTAIALLLLLFFGLGRLAVLVARRIRPVRPAPVRRMALASIARPGAPTAGMVMALGVGLTLMVAVLTVERLAARHLAGAVPAAAPDLLLIDLPPGEAEAIVERTADLPGVARVRHMPFVHGILVAVEGQRLGDGEGQRRVPRDIAWAVRGDRGISWAATAPPGTRIVAGDWWSADTQGPPLASLDAEVARRLGVGLGDRLTLDISGRHIEARIASLRAIDWSVFDLDVPILLAPPADPPPYTHVAAIWAPGADLSTIEAALAADQPDRPAIPVAPLLASVTRMVDAVGLGLRLAAGAAIVAALFVAGGAIAAGYRRRREEMALLGLLGAERGLLARACALELALVAAVAALPAGLLGSLLAHSIVQRLAPEAWAVLPGIPLAVAGVAIALAALAGFGLGRRPARETMRRRRRTG